MTSGIRLLWADDQSDFLDAFRNLVSPLVGSIHCSPDGESALLAVERFSPDVMLVDLQMPPGEWGGLWLLRQMGPALAYVPTIVVSGQGSMKECIEAQDLGALRYVEKERLETDLPQKLQQAISRLDEIRASADYARLRHLERSLHSRIIGTLREEAMRRGEQDIFRSLVPRQIALKTYERMLEQRSGAQEEFMDILDLAKILDEHWNSIHAFGALMTVVRPRKSADRVAWLTRLNESRKLLAHPLRGTLEPDDRQALARAEEILTEWMRIWPAPASAEK